MSSEPKHPLEEKSGGARLPLWLVLLLGVMLCIVPLYLDHRAGDFNGQVYAPYQTLQQVTAAQPQKTVNPLMEKGGKIFAASCAACHQATGLGSPGQFPPLAGSEWVLEKDPARMIRIALLGINGPVTVAGHDWNNGNVMPTMMAAIGGDEEIAAVLTYVRQSWGNTAPGVTVEQVKQAKAALGARTEAETAKELLAVPLNE